METTPMGSGTIYHVQATAQATRNGFPVFAHHRSPSSLWKGKWRPLCTAGIYPFTDAALEDFDPIFEALIGLSGDDPTILYRPDDYARPFLPVAARLAEAAESAEARHRADEARALFLRAAAVYRIARFPVSRSALGEDAWTRGKAAYERGGRLFETPNVPVEIPFGAADPAAGDRAAPIQAYLRLPDGERPAAGWPVLLFLCGLDAYRTDHTPRFDEHVRRGFATLALEIPGTGDCPAAPNDPAAPDRLLTSVLDWIGAEVDARGFDPGTIVARGISTGGYYAFRTAHAQADRLFATVAQGGGCHGMFDPAWIEAQNGMEYPFALADALAWKFGYRDADVAVARRRYAAEGKKFSLLDAGLLDRPACKLLVVNGMEDSIFPIEDSLLVATRGTGKDLVVRGDRGHMGNPGAEAILYDWIDAAVSERRGKQS